MNNDTWMLILLLAVVFGALVAITTFSGRGSLDSIKSKTVGDGQHGTARWATPGEIKKTFRSVPFQPALWRKGERLPSAQGLVLGCTGKKGQLTALVDSDDIHCLMIGASGVGKTAFFLYPNLEYACASGMSFFASDTKRDLARNYGAIARDCYGYQVAVVDLRNPTTQQKFYQDSGFDIKGDSGEIIAYGRGKTVPYDEHMQAVREVERQIGRASCRERV